MKLIYIIDTYPSLNKKAAELALLADVYKNCLVMNDEDWTRVVEDISYAVEALNKRHKNTKPFEVYGKTDKSVFVCVEGSGGCKPVLNVTTAEVNSVYTDEGITLVDSYFNDRK